MESQGKLGLLPTGRAGSLAGRKACSAVPCVQLCLCRQRAKHNVSLVQSNSLSECSDMSGKSVWVSEEAWGVSKRFFSWFCGIWISGSVLFVVAKYWLCFQLHFRLFEQALPQADLKHFTF